MDSLDLRVKLVSLALLDSLEAQARVALKVSLVIPDFQDLLDCQDSLDSQDGKEIGDSLGHWVLMDFQVYRVSRFSAAGWVEVSWLDIFEISERLSA